MELILHGSRQIGRYLTVVILGALFSLGLYQIWELETRWFVIVAGAIAAVAVSMCMVAIFSDFVLITFLFAIPLWSFNKWFWPSRYSGAKQGDLVYGGMFGLGLIDFILIGLYMSWFFRIFISREQEIPRLYLIDLFIGCFVLVHLLSTIGSADPNLGLHSTEFLLKYVLLYFYVSRNLRPQHLPWLVGAIVFALVVEAGLGSYQHLTGKWLGIALDKGAGTSQLDYQYVVPGIETKKRATGMSYDSHALGVFVAMMLPFPLVLYLTPRMKGELRIGFAIASILAVFVVAISFSRSAWLGSAIALTIGIILIVAVWREGQIVPALAVCAAMVLISLPWSAQYVYDRFANSPSGTLTARFEQYKFALNLVQMYPIFGVGPGNYYEALKAHDYLWQDVLPVHNALLWIATETGILGVGLYLTIVLSAIRRLFSFCRKSRDFAARLGMAAIIALLTLEIDGLTEPLFREPSTFTLFWILIALSVALPKFGLASKEAGTEQLGAVLHAG